LLGAEDVKATANACRQLGAEIRVEENLTIVRGTGATGLNPPAKVLDMGNSGTAMRLLTGVLAAQGFASELGGDESLCSRPMARIVDPLSDMGARIATTATRTAPLRINGNPNLRSIDYLLPVASAQVKSCLLLAGLYASGTTCVNEPQQSRDHTEKMLPLFGVELEQPCCVKGGSRLSATDIQVPADISSAAFHLVAAAMIRGSDVLLRQVGINRTRDGIVRVLEAMGADISIENRRMFGAEPVADIRLRYSADIHALDIPVSWVPSLIDEFPAIMALAASLPGTTRIRGAAELRVKESDRLDVMARGLEVLGVELEEFEDGIDITGGAIGGANDGVVVDAAGDHRCAMSFCILGQVASSPVWVKGGSHINTSYPNFVEHVQQLGGNIEVSDTIAVNRDDSQTGYPPVVTIDGPVGSGKGTISLGLARRLGWHFLDSGALYRLVALAAIRRGIKVSAESSLGQLARDLNVEFVMRDGKNVVLLDGETVAGKLRTEEVSSFASEVAAISSVRLALVDRQRAFRKAPGLVADGRDMGTVIFPGANLKIFLTASVEERAARRYKQLKDKGENVTLSRLFHEIKKRDERDRTRLIAPLKPADDAHIIDSTDSDIEEVLDEIMLYFEEKQTVRRKS
jgi:3-phosphoshikimate 1-carboxyvinyltransferase